jgi:hypothetical protein
MNGEGFAMDRVKQHLEEEAREFDRIILTLIPHRLHALI